jgi:serine/threonine protein kinase
LLVTKDDKVYIMDFNVSSKSKNPSEVMRMMTKTGTVAFSAPEIFTQKVYDEKVDIWSAGIVLYMMLAGKTPYEDEDNVNKLV